jgi:hypothetical protein
MIGQTANPRYTYKRLPKHVYVVPYNAELLLLWEGHFNVQFVTDKWRISVIYYKVCYKGGASVFDKYGRNHSGSETSLNP